MTYLKTVSVMLALLFLFCQSGWTGQKSGEKIPWQVIDGGGCAGNSSSYRLSGAAGQTATGPGTSAGYKINQGFWQNTPLSCCTLAGDANNNGTVNVGDAVFLINYIFKLETAPPCRQAADANANGIINIGDIVYLINYIFKLASVPVCGP